MEYVFVKDLAYYFAPHCLDRLHAFVGDADVTHSFIIRHPAKAIVSLYSKSVRDANGNLPPTGYEYFDPVEAGFTALDSIVRYLDEKAGGEGCANLAIVDADDMLEQPEGCIA